MFTQPIRDLVTIGHEWSWGGMALAFIYHYLYIVAY